jgi:hypothetical protein
MPYNPLKVNQLLGTNHLHLQRLNTPSRKPKKEAYCKQGNLLAKISVCVGNKKEMQVKSVPVGSLMGWNVPIAVQGTSFQLPLLSHTTELTNRRQEEDK